MTSVPMTIVRGGSGRRLAAAPKGGIVVIGAARRDEHAQGDHDGYKSNKTLHRSLLIDMNGERTATERRITNSDYGGPCCSRRRSSSGSSPLGGPPPRQHCVTNPA